MLINIRVSELHSNTSNSLPLSIIIAILFNSSIFQILPYDIAVLSAKYNSHINNLLYHIGINKHGNNDYDTLNLNDEILFVTSKI